MILLIDNYDSFVHNLARHFQRLGQTTQVIRNDAIDAAGVARLNPRAIVISPGPCTPNEAGSSLDIVRQWAPRLPILGVCLGHQVIAAALGGTVIRSAQPMHGRTSRVWHQQSGLFAGLPSPLTACRYHSLAVDETTLPAELQVTARTEDRTIMVLEHVELPVVGVQFHPEAILTQGGYELLANFLQQSGITAGDPRGLAVSERPQPAPQRALPDSPVTF